MTLSYTNLEENLIEDFLRRFFHCFHFVNDCRRWAYSYNNYIIINGSNCLCMQLHSMSRPLKCQGQGQGCYLNNIHSLVPMYSVIKGHSHWLVVTLLAKAHLLPQALCL